MKIKAIIFALLIMAASACTQRTCPTYTQEKGSDHPTEQTNS